MPRKLACMGFQETTWKPSAEYSNCKDIANGSLETTLRDITGTDHVYIIHKWRLSYSKLSKSGKELKVEFTGYYKLRNTIYLGTTKEKRYKLKNKHTQNQTETSTEVCVANSPQEKN